MTARLPALVLAALLALTGCSKPGAGTAAATGGPVAPVAPPAGRQWTEIVAATPEGGMRVGNPDAAVKLVEYAAFTCPHCARFEREGAPALLDRYVKSGRVSWELRPMLIHGGPDAAPTLLAACRGPQPYFTLAQQIFANQDTYLDRLTKLPAAEQQRISGLVAGEQFRAWAQAGGLIPFFAARGLPEARATACLTDQKALDKLAADQERYATVDGIQGTPTFFVNGAKDDTVTTWDALEPRLRAALG